MYPTTYTQFVEWKKHLTNIVIAICFIIPNHSQAQIVSQDSLALVDLYKSTQGTNWQQDSNWLGTAPLDKWFGIKTLNNRVVSVDLFNNNLTGSLPNSIGNLTQLTFDLRLEKNNLSGTLPLTLGNLTNLGILNVSGNHLTGNIPTELGTMKSLFYLDLSFNRFNGNIPQEIGNLVNLKSLFFNSNSLNGTVPRTFSNLTLLNYLYLGYNQFNDSIPSFMGNLTNLVSLSLINNQFYGPIPSNIANLNNLKYLDVSQNNLTGTLPDFLSKLANLTDLILDYNSFTGNIPNSYTTLNNLTRLAVDSNYLSGPVPSGFANLPNLRTLQLGGNSFTFDGLEGIANIASYRPQAHIKVNSSGKILSVYAGGTLSNDTFYWRKDNIPYTTIIGDSTFTPIANGNYSVSVTNAVAKKLTLYSDTITISTLPINSISLTARTNLDGSVNLGWATVNEINTDYFDILRSSDGLSFVSIGQIKSKGFGNNVYSFHDCTINDNMNEYFKILSFDKDGKYVGSKVVVATFPTSPNAIKVFPNPTNHFLNIKGVALKQFTILDNHGKTMLTRSVEHSNISTIDVQSFSKGNYSIRYIQNNNQVGTIIFNKE